ncbi:NADH-quinone oxidoreductase subunit A [Buchnera aphidicola (Chaitoregma tattakana)]|uniref:NADH-quinone oxidoreductase subunit A n=1 Tax=Buchnera aphidicola TaxID=9 RepID=UPI0031B82002
MKIYSILVCFISSVVFCLLILLISNFLGNRIASKNKNLPFESGIYSYENSSLKSFVQFYLIVIFFVVFDVESLYLYTWSISVRHTLWPGFFEALCFVFTMFLSLFYIIRLNIFNFNKRY